MGHDVFISHSSQDKIFADAVVAVLERHGIKCWVAPRDILPGASWATSILRAVESSRLMVLVFSSHANSSAHIRREVERAVHFQIPIAPIRVQNVLPTDDLEYFLSASHWMDAITPPFEDHLVKLAEQIRTLLQIVGTEDKAVGEPQPVAAPAEPSPSGRRIMILVAALLLVIVGTIAVISQLGGFKQLFARPSELSNSSAIPASTALSSSTVVNPPPSNAVPAFPSPLKDFTNSIGMRFVKIQPGSFLMGSPANEVDRFDDEVQHKVTLTKGFLMATTPVTQAQWKAVMGTNPSYFKGDDLPVEMVFWNDAMAFCNSMGQKEGKHYRLPTEGEWEYACRAGTTTAYYNGNAEADLDKAAWYSANSDGKTHPVGQKQPNTWGLYDTLGNVLQWCSDVYGNYPNGAVTDPSGAAPNGPAQAGVLRGGSWYDGPRYCRCADRNLNAPGGRSTYIGFRIVLDSD